MVRKLEQLRLRLIRREVSPLELSSARPMLEDSVRSLRTHHCLGQEEEAFLIFLVGEEDDSEHGSFSAEED